MLRSLRIPPLLLAVLTVAACDSSTDPRAGTLPVSFSREITLPDLHDQLATGTARVQVRVIPGGLVAREVQIQGADELADREQVRGRVSAITATGLTLELGGLQIGFTSSTRFRPEAGDESHLRGMSGDNGSSGGSGSGSDLTLADFVARVQAELAAGGQPAVKARRDAPAQPQGPDDASFTASELELDHEADHPVIDMNIAAANLVTNQTPPPDGWIKVLGLMIELRVSAGMTKLEAELPEVQGEHEFEGTVKSVDVTAGTVTLLDGTIVKIVAGTEIEPKEGGDDAHLASLADVQAALAAGTKVRAEGEAMVESASPLTLVAIRIEFEAEDQQEPPAAGMVEFRDMVKSVDVAGSTFTLEGGALVHVTAQTVIDGSSDLRTLQEVADGLAAHTPVRVEGHATSDAAGLPPVLTALDVKFEVDHSGSGG